MALEISACGLLNIELYKLKDKGINSCKLIPRRLVIQGQE